MGNLASSLDPLSLCRKVASRSLFYRYYFGYCSVELSGCVPPPLRRPCNTRQASHSHRYSVEICNPRLNCCGDCFFPSTSKLWNSFPESVFPVYYILYPYSFFFFLKFLDFRFFLFCFNLF